jgi:hypothetical protein
MDQDRLEDPVADDETMVEYRDRGCIFIDEGAVHVDLWHSPTLRAHGRPHVEGPTVLFTCWLAAL